MCSNQDPRRSHHTRVAARRKLLRKYAQAQNGRCAICGCSKDLVLDHCHVAGLIRKALCIRCNVALGMFKDDPKLLKRAAAYLEHFAALFLGDTEKLDVY